MLPKSISSHIHNSIGIEIQDVHSVSGGSINQAVKISSRTGDFFLKWNSDAPADFFEKEAEGLNLLRSADSGLRIPEIIAVVHPNNEQPGFLLMEYIKEGQKGDSQSLGRGLAKIHHHHADLFGLDTNNYIGSLPQRNSQHTDWATFFSEERITPQLKLAVDSGKIEPDTLANWGRLTGKLDDWFPKTKPSLIHGDLWGGNYLFDEQGVGVLIDPATYYGHPEMDLAFSKMFGGFSDDFYEGYNSFSTIEPDFNTRVPLYNLYPLLVHVNLFGGHYTSQAIRLLKKF